MKDLEYNKIVLLLIGVFAVLFSLEGCEGLISVSVGILIVIIGTLLIISILSCKKKENIINFVLVTIAISIIGGGMVNPINSGLDTVYDLQLVQQIEKINNSNPGTWVVESFAMGHLPTMVGAKTMNVTETYPDIEMWKALGLQDYEEMWNRYLHTSIFIDDKTYLELLHTDHAMLHITIDKLYEMGVRYIVTTQDLSENLNVVKLNAANFRTIYKIEM